jgi:hypothetical protein
MRVAPSRINLKKAPPNACALLLLLVTFGSTSEARWAPSPTHTTAYSRNAPRASTLADYRGRVGAAVAPLEGLASFYERAGEGGGTEGSDPAFVRELEKKEGALGRVRALLPPHERVEAGGDSFVEVDNSWLHAALDEYRREGDGRKSMELLRGAAGRLRALEAQLGGAESAPQDKDAERGRLNAILRDPAFNRETRREEGALARLLREFFEWLARLFQRSGRPVMPGASPRATGLAQAIVFALCLGVVAYVGWRVWRRERGTVRLKLKREPRVILGERLEADATAAGLLDDAERLARTGDLRGAIRKAYVALLLELGDRGVVRLSRQRTNRDYLNAVRRAAAPGLYSEMLPLTFDFELHWYGLRDASDADWESFRTRCRQILKQSEP